MASNVLDSEYNPESEGDAFQSDSDNDLDLGSDDESLMEMVKGFRSGKKLVKGLSSKGILGQRSSAKKKKEEEDKSTKKGGKKKQKLNNIEDSSGEASHAEEDHAMEEDGKEEEEFLKDGRIGSLKVRAPTLKVYDFQQMKEHFEVLEEDIEENGLKEGHYIWLLSALTSCAMSNRPHILRYNWVPSESVMGTWRVPVTRSNLHNLSNVFLSSLRSLCEERYENAPRKRRYGFYQPTTEVGKKKEKDKKVPIKTLDTLADQKVHLESYAEVIPCSLTEKAKGKHYDELFFPETLIANKNGELSGGRKTKDDVYRESMIRMETVKRGFGDIFSYEACSPITCDNNVEDTTLHRRLEDGDKGSVLETKEFTVTASMQKSFCNLFFKVTRTFENAKRKNMIANGLNASLITRDKLKESTLSAMRGIFRKLRGTKDKIKNLINADRINNVNTPRGIFQKKSQMSKSKKNGGNSSVDRMSIAHAIGGNLRKLLSPSIPGNQKDAIREQSLKLVDRMGIKDPEGEVKDMIMSFKRFIREMETEEEINEGIRASKEIASFIEIFKEMDGCVNQLSTWNLFVAGSMAPKTYLELRTKPLLQRVNNLQQIGSEIMGNKFFLDSVSHFTALELSRVEASVHFGSKVSPSVVDFALGVPFDQHNGRIFGENVCYNAPFLFGQKPIGTRVCLTRQRGRLRPIVALPRGQIQRKNDRAAPFEAHVPGFTGLSGKIENPCLLVNWQQTFANFKLFIERLKQDLAIDIKSEWEHFDELTETINSIGVVDLPAYPRTQNGIMAKLDAIYYPYQGNDFLSFIMGDRRVLIDPALFRQALEAFREGEELNSKNEAAFLVSARTRVRVHSEMAESDLKIPTLSPNQQRQKLQAIKVIKWSELFATGLLTRSTDLLDDFGPEKTGFQSTDLDPASGQVSTNQDSQMEASTSDAQSNVHELALQQIATQLNFGEKEKALLAQIAS